MRKTRTNSEKITLTVRWEKVGTMASEDFVEEHFEPELIKVIAAAQKEIGKAIYLAACQKAKTAGKFNRLTISVNVSPEIEFGIVK